jgi:hypothetical protein
MERGRSSPGPELGYLVATLATFPPLLGVTLYLWRTSADPFLLLMLGVLTASNGAALAVHVVLWARVRRVVPPEPTVSPEHRPFIIVSALRHTTAKDRWVTLGFLPEGLCIVPRGPGPLGPGLIAAVVAMGMGLAAFFMVDTNPYLGTAVFVGALVVFMTVSAVHFVRTPKQLVSAEAIRKAALTRGEVVSWGQIVRAKVGALGSAGLPQGCMLYIKKPEREVFDIALGVVPAHVSTLLYAHLGDRLAPAGERF